MPSVIAGDTGIPLSQRGQQFVLVPGSPNELAGGKRPRVTLSPTLVTQGDGRPYLALSTPGGDNQDQALLQLLLNVIDFGMNAQVALEAPRFQTRHLVSSFDNHAMSPGDLLLDDRTTSEAVNTLTQKGHKIESRSRWASGSAPTMIRITPGGVLDHLRVHAREDVVEALARALQAIGQRRTLLLDHREDRLHVGVGRQRVGGRQRSGVRLHAQAPRARTIRPARQRPQTVALPESSPTSTHAQAGPGRLPTALPER